MIEGFIWGTMSAMLAIIIEPYLKTRGSDRSLRGLLILLQKSYWQGVFLTVLLAPLCEEFIFRFGGFWLLRRWNVAEITILIVTSTLFGLAHAQFPNNVITGFIGLLLGYVYLRVGFVGAVMAHASHNFWVLLHLLAVYYRATGVSIKQSLHKMSVEQVAMRYEAALKKTSDHIGDK